ncbi:AraC family ligand binding domain-containing protein [Gallaecimonas kandeliae]|uniref:AraC family ligand binding domain-containing protein n=1 Tax=Gallaecimonas kandeliae TaxID=3029055 RepID=UPI002649144F|nr:AraC family ligand binding domain-containing protein [Gallaecimonas kandeliae]WKE63935.1 AraC family ligand binding domain-containing protein [Gallaecimonas kandeliae]
MYLPVTLESRHYAKARLSARQRLATGLLVHWQAGLGALRLGKAYHPLRTGDLLWLPADTLFALGASDDSTFDCAWLSARLDLPMPEKLGLLTDPWLALTLDKAKSKQGEARALLLRCLALGLEGQKLKALPAPLAWPAQGSLAPLALIEAGRQGRHQAGVDIDPRPLPLSPEG